MMGNGARDLDVVSLSPSAALDASLTAVAMRYIDAYRHDLVGAQHCVELPELRNTVKLLAAVDDLTKDQEKIAVRLVKELVRIVVKAVSTTAMDTENVRGFVHLDDNLFPVMEFLAAFADKIENSKSSTTKAAPSAAELVRWTPFVIYASAFFTCGQLPAYDSMKCTELANQMLETCQRLHGQPTKEALLGISFDRVVALVSQDIAKDEWIAEHSITKFALQWVVLQVPFPRFGGDVLGRIFALVFPLVDDLTNATQIVGARMLLHIVDNVTSTELRWYTDVLLEVLRGAITSRKPATLDLLVGTLVAALDKLSPPEDFQYYDRFVPRLLNDFSLCSEVESRVLYTRHLRAVATRLGAPHSIYLIRFLQPLLKVLVASFDSVQASLIKETLETLRVTVLCAWPRIPHHTEEIFVAVLKAVSLCEAFPDTGNLKHLPNQEDKQIISAMCEDIVSLLSELDKPHVHKLLHLVASECNALKPFATRMQEKLT